MQGRGTGTTLKRQIRRSEREIPVHSRAFPLHSGNSPWAQKGRGDFASYGKGIWEEQEGRKAARVPVEVEE